MTRPAALICAAVAAIGMAVWVSYQVFPARGDAGELTVSEMPGTAGGTEAKSSGKLHQVREYPPKQGRLASPFLPEHPTREDRKKTAEPKKQAPPTGRPAPETSAPQELRLVGVVSAETGRRAIVAVGKKQKLLAPGEENDGITLLSVTDMEAVVSTPTGERTLSLSSGLVK